MKTLEQKIEEILTEIGAAKDYQESIRYENREQVTPLEQIQYADAKAAIAAYDYAMRIIKQKLDWGKP